MKFVKSHWKAALTLDRIRACLMSSDNFRWSHLAWSRHLIEGKENVFKTIQNVNFSWPSFAPSLLRKFSSCAETRKSLDNFRRRSTLKPSCREYMRAQYQISAASSPSRLSFLLLILFYCHRKLSESLCLQKYKFSYLIFRVQHNIDNIAFFLIPSHIECCPWFLQIFLRKIHRPETVRSLENFLKLIGKLPKFCLSCEKFTILQISFSVYYDYLSIFALHFNTAQKGSWPSKRTRCRHTQPLQRFKAN